ncbi:MAG: sugar ABC transporter ATP-binding protein [Planctomycetota bacterium]
MPLLQLQSICKSFPGVNALTNVSLSLDRGQVVALMGENGAGKSTLIRILGGAHRPDSGTIRIDGSDVELRSPTNAMDAGIGIIYQEFNLVPALSVMDNLFLGQSQQTVWIHRTEERARAESVFRRMGVTMSLDSQVRHLSIAQQQLVEIARVLLRDIRILVMDEPSAALTPQEVSQLFVLIRELKNQGIGIIYISHRLEEVFELADVITVLRDGHHIADVDAKNIDRLKLIELMVGRNLGGEFQRKPHSPGETVLEARNLSRNQAVRNISLKLRRGEIVGLTGLVGAGRTEVARLLFGADQPTSGQIFLRGRETKLRSPADAIDSGICLLTEDRKQHGLIPARSVRENFSLSSLQKLQSAGFVHQREEKAIFSNYVDRLRIRISDQNQPAGNLSGGNQQKVLLARWLYRDADVFLFDEPTRGIDVGAKQEIYKMISDLAAQGKAILVISSELPEIICLCDRILVMRNGQISGELQNWPRVTQEQMMDLAAG